MALDAGTGTGVMFTPPSTEMFRSALRRAHDLYSDTPTWRRLMKNAMKTDVSWSRSAARYEKLYEGLLAERAR